MDDRLQPLLSQIKRQNKFPPRYRVQKIKEEFNSRGVLQSSMAAEAIAKAYIESAESILDGFSEALIRNSKELNLTDQQIQETSNEALKQIYAEATGCIAEAIPWSDHYRALAIRRLEESRSGLIDHIQEVVVDDLPLLPIRSYRLVASTSRSDGPARIP